MLLVVVVVAVVSSTMIPLLSKMIAAVNKRIAVVFVASVHGRFTSNVIFDGLLVVNSWSGLVGCLVG